MTNEPDQSPVGSKKLELERARAELENATTSAHRNRMDTVFIALVSEKRKAVRKLEAELAALQPKVPETKPAGRKLSAAEVGQLRSFEIQYEKIRKICERDPSTTNLARHSVAKRELAAFRKRLGV